MSENSANPPQHMSFLQARERWTRTEVAFWLALAGVYFAFPTSLLFASQILITGLFALSLDMIMGYAGIVTLGHAAFFGIGAYTAGMLSAHGWHEPLSGLAAAGAAAGVAGYLSSFLLLRGGELTRLMITLGIGSLLFEAANKATDLTGGVDGLQGVEIGKVFGIFSFGLYGRTAYVYVLCVVFLLFVFARSLMHSPFGLALRSIRENKVRALAVGIPIGAYQSNIYALSAVFAGISGALLTQTTQYVGIDVLSFQRSADLLIMLIIGGAATMYGAFVGAGAFLLAQNHLSNLNPQYWLFWLGILLILMTRFLSGGIMDGLSRLARLLRRSFKKERS